MCCHSLSSPHICSYFSLKIGMQSNIAFSEETKIVLSSINSASVSTPDEDQTLHNSDDEFERMLPSVINKETLSILEAKLGLGGGGDWWIDPSRDPIEIDSEGNRDEGAILDVEASCRNWYRAPFDRDPEFCNDSYHLLNRLNELARIKGLIEEASLRKQSVNQVDVNNTDRQIYHSTLSVNGSMDFSNMISPHTNHDIQNIDPLADLRRSLNGPFRDLQSDVYGTYALRKSKNNQKVPLGEVFDVRTHESDYTRYPDKPQPPFSQAMHSGLPQLHKSHQPPSPHSIPVTNISPIFGRRKVSTKSNQPAYTSGSTSVPDPKVCGQKRSVLSRTYSKEQMDFLKEVSEYQVTDSILKVPSLLARSHALTASLPISDNEGDIDVTKSLDISSTVNPLSQSLSASELTMKGRKLSEKVNTSYSSMRSSDVFELARLQETHLREHSGSRGKLDCSNSSLTGSSIGEKNQKKGDGADSTGRKSTSGLSSCDVSATHSREEIVAEDQNGKPERQHTITANECGFNPLQGSIGCEPKVNLSSSVDACVNLSSDEVTTPSKPLNSTYDAPDFKCVYGSDPATSQIDGVEGHRPIIGATDSAISNTNEHYAQATGCVRHTSYIGDDAKQTDGNRRRLDASYDLKDRDILVEHESDSGVLTNRVEAPRLNAVLKSMESPQVADPSNTSSTNSLVPPTVINNAESHEPSQCKQYDVKPHTKTLIPLPSGKLSRLPMPSQKMPSMSVSSRLGSRKSATSEQGSNSAHSTNKTQLSAPKVIYLVFAALG
uniref:Uncharacterized protein n=2 Tax=Trichobilharzia regenti TaxID=157069 RepID=A0AA85JIG9_TRIRE|nr:unnamed protein product [Trichobilharzia regenti]